MPALNFQERFAGPVEGGEKLQTIRRERKRPIMVGQTLYLYAGMRTKKCRKLGEAMCIYLSVIKIAQDGAYISLATRDEPLERDLDEFAQKDGFKDWPEMRDWFDARYGLPFEGVLIGWDRVINARGEK